MTLREQIERIDPETIVSLKNKYGVFWIGRAKFVFGAVRKEAWNGTHIEVIIKRGNMVRFTANKKGNVTTQAEDIEEYCPYCDTYVHILWNVHEDGYKIYCPYCGHKMMLCSMCFQNCDWCKESGCKMERIKKVKVRKIGD